MSMTVGFGSYILGSVFSAPKAQAKESTKKPYVSPLVPEEAGFEDLGIVFQSGSAQIDRTKPEYYVDDSLEYFYFLECGRVTAMRATATDFIGPIRLFNRFLNGEQLAEEIHAVQKGNKGPYYVCERLKRSPLGIFSRKEQEELIKRYGPKEEPAGAYVYEAKTIDSSSRRNGNGEEQRSESSTIESINVQITNLAAPLVREILRNCSSKEQEVKFVQALDAGFDGKKFNGKRDNLITRAEVLPFYYWLHDQANAAVKAKRKAPKTKT